MLTSLPPPAVLSLVTSFPAARVLLVPTSIIAAAVDEGKAVAVTLGQQEAVAPEGAPQKLNFSPTPSEQSTLDGRSSGGLLPETSVLAEALVGDAAQQLELKEGGGWRRKMDTHEMKP